MAVAPQQALDKAVVKAEEAVAEARPWLEPAARLGYAAKGFVYLLIGVLAVLAAWNVHVGQGRADMNQRGVLNYLARQPLGIGLLIAIAVGLGGYALWRLLSATLNLELKRPMKRIGYAISGMAYGYLAFLAVEAVVERRVNSDEHSFARTLVEKPFGHVLLVIAGCVTLAIAGGQVWAAISGQLMKSLDRNAMARWLQTAAVWTGRIGFVARGLLFGLIGGFFIEAAIVHDVHKAGGVGQALATMQHSIGGNWLLGADCVGLVCYGLFMCVMARYREIRMPQPS